MELLKKTALTCGSIIVLLIILELFLRVSGYKVATFYPHGEFHNYDPELGWIQKPNHKAIFEGLDFKVTVTSNSQGFRDREYSIEKPPETKRVIVLGDSFAWGWGVENDEVFTEVAERQLNKVEILNLGHSSYGTDQELLLWKRLGQRFSPDLTAVVFYSNDIEDNSGPTGERPQFILKDGTLSLAKTPQPWTMIRNLKRVLKDNLRLYYFIDYRIALLKQSRKHPNSGSGLEKWFFKDFLDRMGNAWEVTKALLLEIDRLTDHRTLVVFIPNRLQLEDDRFLEALQTAHLEDDKTDRMLTNRLLETFCTEHQIPFLDLTSRFQKERTHEPLYFDHDFHWSPRGHHVAGEALGETLRYLLVPAADHQISTLRK